MSRFPSLEAHSLKRKSHYPPDVYIQREEQKEDVMSEDFVRDGYKYVKPVRDEYDSCKKESKFINVESLRKFYHDVLNRKIELNSCLDSKKKTSVSLRDSFVPFIDIHRTQISDWFKELAGTHSMQNLGKRVPYSKDKEEILNEVVSNKVSLTRAVWLINISIIHATAHAETTKRKPRAPFDPTCDWIGAIFRILERILEQLTAEPSCSDSEDDWNYLFALLIALYDADIADHWDVLVWLVKRAEGIWKPAGDDQDKQPSTTADITSDTLSIARFYLGCLLKFGSRFTENELITRRLLFWCCKLFNHLVIKDMRMPTDLKTLLERYTEISSCPIHAEIVKNLSCLITSLTLKNPSSVVWNNIPFETEHTYLKGSPLDSIPFSLSALPMPNVPETLSIRSFVLDLEDVIITRSKLSESGWNHHALSGPRGEHLQSLARLLDILDLQDYYLVQNNNPIEALFNRIFVEETVKTDTASVVTTLCEWAVSVHRVGIYRSIIVACLLEKLHSTLRSHSDPCNVLQETLMDFLDSFASNLPPFTTDRAPLDNQAMRSLVSLFSELIDREVFSHDVYVRRMIARGAFGTTYHPLANETASGSNQQTITNATPSVHSHTPRLRAFPSSTNLSSFPLNSSANQFSVASEFSEDLDRTSMDNPDSVRSELGLPAAPAGPSQPNVDNMSMRSPHFHYLAQFPLPQDETYVHEENQRAQLLYGSMRSKDRARSRIRQLARDICKLFTRKIYLVDVVHGEMGRRKKGKERDRDREIPQQVSGQTNAAYQKEETHSIDKLHEDIMSRFLQLSYHDMECVISHCTPTFIKMLSGNQGVSSLATEDHSTSSTNPSSPHTSTNLAPSHIYMPVPSSIFLFFELIEHSLNITCLISIIVDSMERLQTLFKARTSFMALYLSFLFLRAIGVLQRYQPVLFVMGDLATRLFPTLITQVLQIKDPAQCGPFERCILAYIHDLFKSNLVIKYRFSQTYGRAHPRVSTLFASVEPCDGIGEYDADYANDLLKANMLDNLASLRACYEHLRTSANARYSFVCRAIIFVCQASTIERVNYLCGLCAELTAQCSELTPEWLGSLYAVLAPRPYPHSYAPVVNAVGPGDTYMYDNLSSLIGTLLSRHCFTIGDFLRRVICPAMAQGLDQPVGPNLEPSIRLACYVLHRLFTAESTVSSLQSASTVLTPNREPPSAPQSLSSIDSSLSSPIFQISEPLLLTGALQKVTPVLLVDVLKMLMVHNDKAGLSDLKSGLSTADSERDSEATPAFDELEHKSTDSETDEETEYASNDGARRKRKRISEGRPSGKKRNRTMDNDSPTLHPAVHRFLEFGLLPTISELRSLPLSGLIQLVLREICTLPWVRDMFHRMLPKMLICRNVLIDEKFSPSQARRLLHIIFHPFDTLWSDISHLPSAMCEVLSNLQLWTLRSSQMKFQLLYAQIPFAQRTDVLSSVGQAVVHGFQTQALQWLVSNGLSSDGTFGPIGGLSTFELNDTDPVWLLSTLVPELPKSVKTQIVKATFETLRGIKNFWKHKNDEDKENVLLNHSVLLAHPAFACLLEKCLDLDPMDSLYEQVDYFVENARATRDRVPDNLRTRQIVQECLRLRLTLIGKRFQALQADPEASTAWALLLTQLISHGVTEPESNTALFYMVYDMLQAFVHTLAAKSDLEGKHYQNFVKKARRELAERPSTYGIEHLKPLLPPLKAGCPVIVTGKIGSQVNSSGQSGATHSSNTGSGTNKTAGSGKAGLSKGSGKCEGGRGTGASSTSEAREHNRALSVLTKERIAPWDLYDPTKQFLLLSMHGAMHVEAVPSRTEEQATRLIRHDHFILMRRSPDFYLTPVYTTRTDDRPVGTPDGKLNGARAQAVTSSNAVSCVMSAQESQAPIRYGGPAVSTPGKVFMTARNDGNFRQAPLPKHMVNSEIREAVCRDQRENPMPVDNYRCAPAMPYVYQQRQHVSAVDPTLSHPLRPAGPSSIARNVPGSHFSQPMQHADVYPSGDPRQPQGKRRFSDLQSDPIEEPFEAANQKVMRVSGKFPGDIPGSSSGTVVSTPKRKRGVGRRGSVSSADQRANAGVHQNPKMMDYQVMANQRSALDPSIPSEGDQWSGIDANRSSIPMNNFRGFIRNRAQQNQQQRAAAQQSQLYASIPDQGQAAGRTCLPDHMTHQLPQSVVSNTSYHDMNEYNMMEIRSTGAVGPTNELVSHVPRQFVNGPPQTQRFIVQQQRSGPGIPQANVGGHQLTVPNPPPYPVSQQNITQIQNPSGYGRNAEDNYLFVVENDPDESFSRMGGVPAYRQQAYPGHPAHLQQQVRIDSMAPVVYQRLPNSGQVVRADPPMHVTHPSQNTSSPRQYSRFVPYQ